MNSEVEDSDATVAPDAEEPMSDEDSDAEAAGEKSPSFLNTQTAVFSNSGGRSDESSQPMSPELPLASGEQRRAKSRTASASVSIAAVSETQCTSSNNSGGSSSQQVDSSDPETAGMEVDDVARQQMALLLSLHQAESMHVNSSGKLKKLKDKATEIESSLKEISIANQVERKRLAMAHSSLSQQSQSPARVVEDSQSIRQQLLSLAARQKRLLQCFKTQKELAEKLEKVSARCKFQACGKEMAPASCVSVLEKSREKVESGLVKPSSLSAAIPNLLQHLKPQTQSGVQCLEATSHQKLPATTSAQAKPMTLHTQQLLSSKSTNSANANVCMIQHLPQNSVQVPQEVAPPSFSTTPAGTQRMKLNTMPPLQTTVVQPPPPLTKTQPHIQQSRLPQSQAVSQAQLQSQALAVPVPLETLIQHHFLEPGKDCISCLLMGCEFKCSLLESGSLCTLTGAKYKTPNQWVNFCWSQLGQHKHSTKTKGAYKNVMYRGIPLMSICEQFNRKQVSSYHQMVIQRKQDQITPRKDSAQQRPMNVAISCVPRKPVAAQLPSWPKVSRNVNDLLMAGQVFLVDRGSVGSLQLPDEFWGMNDVPLPTQLVQQLEKDLKW